MIQDQAALDALAEEWDALYARCAGTTPFQSHAWITAWSRAYCPPGRLRVVVARRNGELLAVMPLFLEERGPWRVLAPLGGSISDHTDLLAAELDEAMSSALCDALLSQRGWHMVDWPDVRPDAAVHEWIRSWPGRVTRLRSSTCLELPVEPMAELLARMPSRTANTMQRKLRKVATAGVDVREIAAAGIPAAIARLLDLHAEQWAGRGGNPEHLTDRFRRHLTEALSQLVTDGRAAVAEYRIDHELLLSQVLLIGPQTLSYYLAGISPRLRQRLDTSALLVSHDIEAARNRGLARYSMLRGDEDYKLRWRPDVVTQDRLLLSRPGLRGAVLLPLAARSRAAAVRMAKDRTPWLRPLLRR